MKHLQALQKVLMKHVIDYLENRRNLTAKWAAATARFVSSLVVTATLIGAVIYWNCALSVYDMVVLGTAITVSLVGDFVLFMLVGLAGDELAAARVTAEEATKAHLNETIFKDNEVCIRQVKLR